MKKVMFLGVLVCLAFVVPPGIHAEDLLRVGAFNRDALNVIAEEKGFLRQENLRVEVTLVNNSVDLMRNLIEGKCDIIHTNADNIIAWTEGQAEDPQPHDFVIFMGGNKGVRQLLVVGPGISSIGDLRGKVLAVDDPRTGYAPVLVYMLKQQGLVLNKDYTLKSFGNTRKRADAIGKGDAAGALINLPKEEIQERGFKVLGKSEDAVPVYARGVGAARRDWADGHEAMLVRYIRAMVRATDWVLDRNNREEALGLLLPANKNSTSRAEKMYKDAVHPSLGYVRGSQIEREGIAAVIKLRDAMGVMKSPLPAPEKYVDGRFYQKAVAAP